MEQYLLSFQELFYFWNSGNFLARKERFVESHLTWRQSSVPLLHNIFMKGATRFRIYPPSVLKMTKLRYKTQINDTLEVDKIYCKLLDSN